MSKKELAEKLELCRETLANAIELLDAHDLSGDLDLSDDDLNYLFLDKK